jgi:hypothetical protein
MIYTYPAFWKNSMAGSTSFFRYPLWIANYGVSSPQQLGWPHWTFWQYTSTGTVDGISTPGATDISVFNGTSLDLAALAEAGSWGPATSTAAESSNGGPDPGASCPGSRYIPVTPERFVDTRDGRGGVSGPVSGTATVTLPGSVPADASTVVLDVSAVSPRGPGYLRVAPAGTAPTTTVLNFPAGHSVTGLVQTTSDAQHRIDISTYGSASDLTVDLVGYYTTTAGVGGHYVPVDATRVVDTRSGTGAPAGRMTTDLVFSLPGSVPSDAVGVVLDVTAVDPVGDGYLRLAPTGTTATTTAVNFEGGGSTTGLAVTRSSSGKVTVSIAGSSSNLVVDLLGYYDGASSSGSGYVPVTPTRFVDTRRGLAASGPGAGPLAVTLPSSIPPDATAVLLDVSIVAPSGKGYIRFAAPGTPATTTALNVLAGESRTGLVVTGQRDGQLTLATYGMKSHLVIDLVGYQSNCVPPPSPSPSPSASPAASVSATPAAAARP